MAMDSDTPQRNSPEQASDNAGSGDAMGVLSYVMAGVLFYGGVGWLLGRWLHQAWILPVGMVLGLAASVYLIVKRYGPVDRAPDSNEEGK